MKSNLDQFLSHDPAMNFIVFQLKFIKFKPKIKFIKFEFHNYDVGGLSANVSVLCCLVAAAAAGGCGRDETTAGLSAHYVVYTMTDSVNPCIRQ